MATLLCCSPAKNPDTEVPPAYAVWDGVFQEVDALIVADDGKFWNHSLQGPLMFVDPETRQLIANQNDDSGSFGQYGQVFVDTLPPDVIIANTALEWKGKSWTMVMRPLPEDQASRNGLILHELFHRIQSKIGFGELKERDNAHLDTFEGRLLLRLELEALLQAIQRAEPEKQKKHVKNALSFRASRYSTPEIKQAENTLELNEGLAEYTGLMLSNRPRTEVPEYFQNRVEAFYQNPSFVRSFAYETIPMYGYLLAQEKNNWHQEIDASTLLSDYLKVAFGIQELNPAPYEGMATQEDYAYAEILKQEEQREKERLVQLAAYKTLFLESPSLRLDFMNMNLSLDPGNLVPLEGHGTVYPTMTISDTWGVLEVKNGGLISADWTHVIVSEPQEVSEKLIRGEGWQLTLAANWVLDKGEKGYVVKKPD